ncbi:unnamed protein product [Rhodiola kirilowii]
MANRIAACFGPCSSGVAEESDQETEANLHNDLLWHKDYGQCGCGHYSMAVLQGNLVIEDQCQFESFGQFGTFVGIYDGHNGPDAARFVFDHIFQIFQEEIIGVAGNNQSVTAETFRTVFRRMELEFFVHVRELWNERPSIATVGTCCLVGVVYQQTLIVANCGDSRAVLGGRNREITQLSIDHNVSDPVIRTALRAYFRQDPNIVVFNRGAWRVKGISQVSRTIGDAFMKRPEYNTNAIDARFRLQPPYRMAYLHANPDTNTYQLQQDDSFIIFASHGLWEYLSNDEAVEIVHKHPRSGSAKKLIKAALKRAARIHNMSYRRLRRLGKNSRRNFHDDITVIVLFLNHDLIAAGSVQDTPVSVRSALDH